MSVQARTNETVSTEESMDDHGLADAIAWLENGVYLERWQYCYIGEDAEGRHHHLDEQEDVVYVTDREAEKYTPAGSTLPRWRIVGMADVVQPLDDRPIETWLEYVRSRCGWADLQISIYDFSSAFEGVF